MSMGDPTICCWQPRANKQYSLFASQQPTWKLWTLNPKPYSSYIISHCCSPASCMIGLTKWVHNVGCRTHSSANDSTHVQMISPLRTQIQHKVGCSMVLTLWKLLEPMGTQYCTKWAPAGSHFVESCWTHWVYNIAQSGFL
jgi:hypothetical protein